jgi:O-antigen biosynthesis protein
MKNALIMVTCNNYGKLIEALKSIYECTHPPYHLFIVDNASIDKTLGLYGARLPNTTIIRNCENLWWGNSINVGIRLSWRDDFDTIFFLNDDIIVGPHWLENHVKALEDKSLGAVGPLNSHKRDWQNYGRVLSTFKDIGLPQFNIDSEDVVNMNLELQKINLNPLKVKGMLAFFCVAFRKEVIAKIGYLDERFIMGGDDDDYCARLEEAGYSLALLLNTYVIHHAGSSINKLDPEVFAQMKKKNIELLKQKYPNRYKG